MSDRVLLRNIDCSLFDKSIASDPIHMKTINAKTKITICRSGESMMPFALRKYEAKTGATIRKRGINPADKSTTM